MNKISEGMKKIILICIILSAMFSVSAKCGVGVQAGADFSRKNIEDKNLPFVSVSFAMDSSPWVESLDYNVKNKSVEINFENWVIYKKISGTFNRYFLWGFGFGASFSDSKKIFSDSRLGAGLNYFAGENGSFEFYIQAVWALTYGIKKDSDYKAFLDPLRFPVSGGIRFWF